MIVTKVVGKKGERGKGGGGGGGGSAKRIKANPIIVNDTMLLSKVERSLSKTVYKSSPSSTPQCLSLMATRK